MKKLKTIDIIAIYSVVKGSKVTKVENSVDRYAIVKNIRPLKKIVENFESWKNDAIESLKPSNYKEMENRLNEWRNQEQEGNVTLTIEERIEINGFFDKFGKEVDGCMKSELDKEHDLELVSIGRKSVEQYIDSNDWNVEQVMLVEDFLEN